jgi:hypothetical protein
MHLRAQQSAEACNVVPSSKFRPTNLSGVRDKREIMPSTRSSARGLHAKHRGRLLHCLCCDRYSCPLRRLERGRRQCWLASQNGFVQFWALLKPKCDSVIRKLWQPMGTSQNVVWSWAGPRTSGREGEHSITEREILCKDKHVPVLN